MKLNVGDYVRTKNGSIFKIIGGNEDNWDLDISFGYLETFEEEWLELYRYNDNYSFFNDKSIIKSSPNIIDILEVGDYVNGYRISYSGGFYQYWDDMFDKNTIETDKDIKSILTYEQFEAMQYVVGEEQ